MKKHYNYLKYLIKHKYYVFVAGRKLRVPIWRLVIHDWSKFLPSEWFAYVETFYGDNPSWENGLKYLNHPYKWSKEYWRDKFDYSWLAHQHRSPHHNQHWILREDSGSVKVLKMPEVYAREMVADWSGAGKAITGEWEVSEWYEKNKGRITLHENTREFVEGLLLGFSKINK